MNLSYKAVYEESWNLFFNEISKGQAEPNLCSHIFLVWFLIFRSGSIYIQILGHREFSHGIFEVFIAIKPDPVVSDFKFHRHLPKFLPFILRQAVDPEGSSSTLEKGLEILMNKIPRFLPKYLFSRDNLSKNSMNIFLSLCILK